MPRKFRVLLGGICFNFLLIFFGCGEKPLSNEELASQAESLLDAGQPEIAIRLLEARLEEQPNRVDLLEPLAFAYAAIGDSAMSAMTYIQIAELTDERADARLWAAESLLSVEDSEGAVNQYQEYLKVKPNDRAVWIALGKLHGDLGNMSGAIAAYLEANRIQEDPVITAALGRLYLRSNNLAQAQRYFAQSYSLGGDNRGEVLLGLLETSIRAKQFTDAEKLVTQLDEEYPGLLDRSEISEVRDQLNQWRKSREEAQLALAELEAGRRNAMNNPETLEATSEPSAPLSEVAEEDSQASEMLETETSVAEAKTSEVDSEEVPAKEEMTPRIEESERAVAVTPEATERPTTWEGWLALARKNRAEGQMREAVSAYKRVLVQRDNLAEIWGELSQTYFEAGDFRWAQATASEAMRREVDNPKYHLMYLKAAAENLPSGQVLEEMERTYRQFPNSPEVILVLAKAYLENRNFRNARILLERFLNQVDRSHPEYAQVEATVRQMQADQ